MPALSCQRSLWWGNWWGEHECRVASGCPLMWRFLRGLAIDVASAVVAVAECDCESCPCTGWVFHWGLGVVAVLVVVVLVVGRPPPQPQSPSRCAPERLRSAQGLAPCLALGCEPRQSVLRKYAPKIQLRQTTYVLTRAKSTDVSFAVVAFMVAFVAGAVVAIRNYFF